ncbi:hypothetical protein BD310DRAFT_943503 [Dichomitus squalens]|uniref:Uncharacterized protein n=1 Tax=Dichomitus squalens TaxID=114155 RepID=A0A4V2KA14_9APHY|nr:hypothetical protein BD310DRAFT_943503 [Dichomitus squalens]
MTEAFDAQMTDSGDVDVSMYSGMATTDSWLSVEASMGDDDHAADAATYHYEQEGIEIEMGDDDEDAPITEYEMADEGEGYDGSEIQDIEVYDISQIASPLPVDDNVFSANHPSHAEDTEIMHIPLPSDGPVEPLLPATTPVEVTVETEVITAVDPTPPGDNFPTTDVADDDSLVSPQQNAIPATAAQVPEARTVHVDTPAPDDSFIPVADASRTSTSHSGFVEVTTHQDAPEQAAVEHEYLPQHDLSTQPDLSEHNDHAGDDPAVTDDRDRGAAVVNESPHGVAVDGNDPHEISDGVYIDPPPAVLLSLPPSADFGECCLFNLPTSSSPQSPSSSAQPDTGDGPRLLLQERPTLYYEPLSAVFAALRQEQCIHSMPGFAEAELVLDAYDLQLTVSEDNVYTHEVTLHELNVIHDGSDLSGPLRLRLKIFSPRFATRYSMLRDQISRLNFVEDGDAHADAAPVQQDQPNLTHDGQHDGEDGEQQPPEYSVPEVHTSGYADEEAHVPGTGVATAVNGAEQELTDADALQGTTGEAEEALSKTDDAATAREGVVAGVDPAVQAKQLAAAQERIEDEADEDEDEDASGEYDDEGPTFDADEVHGPPAEEGGDYLDQTTFPDDEDEFGEDLPEEIGGETRDEAYPYIGATDDQSERPQDANDFERGVDLGVVGEHEEQQYDDTGLHTNPYTDLHDEPNSNDALEAGVEDPLHPTSEEYTEEDVVKKTANAGHKESVALPTEAEDGLDDNWDEADTLSSHENADALEHSAVLSRKSSTATLASGVSKRAYDEVDLDDFDDDEDDFDTAASSPSAKRLRTQ